VNAGEIVNHIVKCNRVFVVFDFHAEGIRQTGELTHPHSHRQVLPFDEAGRNMGLIRFAADRRFFVLVHSEFRIAANR
jgi:hypothetical protein